MKRFIILSVFILIFANCSALPPKLTEKEMQEDINFLVMAIKEIEPNISVRERVTGTKIIAKIDSLAAVAKNLKTFEEFYYLAQKILLLCQDQHEKFQTIDDAEKQNYYISKQGNEITKLCNSMFPKYKLIRTIPNVRYINNKYFFVDNVYKIKSDSVLFRAGTQILAINDIDIDKYVNNINLFYDNSVKWDVNKKQYYTNRIFWLDVIDSKTIDRKITYKFNNKIETKLIQEGISVNDKSSYIDTAKVDFFENDKILYTRIPEMDYEKIDFYLKEIKKYKDKEIAKIIVDVRGNGGGNDWVWINVLRAIIDKPIIYNSDFCYKNTPLVLNYLKKIRNFKVLDKYFSANQIENNSFLCSSSLDTINPSTSSLNYDENIYVFADNSIYSSTIAFLSFCNKTDKIITVGQPSGYILGRSNTPFFLSLPNSKLIFWLVPNLDISNSQNISKENYDYYRDIFVEPTIDEYIFEKNYTKERYSKDFLYNHDPVFQKVLELE